MTHMSPSVSAAWGGLLEMLDVAGLCEADIIGTTGSPAPFSEQEFLELIGGITEEGGSFTAVQRTLILAEWRKRTGTSRSSGNVSAIPSSSMVAATDADISSTTTRRKDHNNINNNSSNKTTPPPPVTTRRQQPPATSYGHMDSPPSPSHTISTSRINPQQLHPYSHVGTSAVAQQLCALLEEGNAAPALHAASEMMERDAAELIQVLHTFLPHIPTIQLQDILGIRVGDGDSSSPQHNNNSTLASLSNVSHVPGSSSPRGGGGIGGGFSSPVGAMEARLAAHGMSPSSHQPSSSRHTVNQSGGLRDDSVARMEYNDALKQYEQHKNGDYSSSPAPSSSRGGGGVGVRQQPRVVDIPPSVNGIIAPEGMLLTTQALSAQYGNGCLATCNGGKILHLPHVLQPGDCITVLRAQELVAVERERERNYRKH